MCRLVSHSTSSSDDRWYNKMRPFARHSWTVPLAQNRNRVKNSTGVLGTMADRHTVERTAAVLGAMSIVGPGFSLSPSCGKASSHAMIGRLRSNLPWSKALRVVVCDAYRRCHQIVMSCCQMSILHPGLASACTNRLPVDDPPACRASRGVRPTGWFSSPLRSFSHPSGPPQRHPAAGLQIEALRCCVLPVPLVFQLSLRPCHVRCLRTFEAATRHPWSSKVLGPPEVLPSGRVYACSV